LQRVAARATHLNNDNYFSNPHWIVDTPMQAKALPTPTERDNSGIYTDWEDGQTDAQTDREDLTDFEGSGRPERSPSRSRKKRESGSISRWEKLKKSLHWSEVAV
jgi:hypothetical protein